MIGKCLQRIKILDIRRQRFQRVFGTNDGKQVLAYLKRRLMPNDTPFHSDQLEMARRAGHQEAFMIIAHMTYMSDEEIQKLKESNNV